MKEVLTAKQVCQVVAKFDLPFLKSPVKTPASNIERKSWQNKVGVNKEDTDSCQKTLICAAEISDNNKKKKLFP